MDKDTSNNKPAANANQSNQQGAGNQPRQNSHKQGKIPYPLDPEKQKKYFDDRQKNLEGFQKNLEERKKALDEREKGLDEREKALKIRENNVSVKEKNNESDRETLNTDKVELHKREAAVAEAEKEMEASFPAKLAEHNKKLADLTKTFSDKVYKEYGETLKGQLAKITQLIENECTEIRNTISTERSNWAAEKQAQQDQLNQKLLECSNKEGALQALEERLAVREEKIEETIKIRVAEFKKESDSKIQNLEESNNAYLRELKKLKLQIRNFERLQLMVDDKSILKVGPEEAKGVILTLKEKDAEIEKLNNELLNRPTNSELENYKALVEKKDKLIESMQKNQVAYEEIKADSAKLNQFEIEKAKLEGKVKLYESQLESRNIQITSLKNDLQQCRFPEADSQDRATRIKALENGYQIKDNVVLPVPVNKNEDKDKNKVVVDEMKWLTNIHEKCAKHGLRFNMRILKAFHTSLKIAEMSPLTILAGVSGAGKSELPRVYSFFGGLEFLEVPVQPNWDSQESMLGFYNPISNVFDAQEVLQFLVQSQKLLKDAVCMVLLDEMNLARPEQYFADFLSKLESRRDLGDNVPKLDIKIGVNMSYKLELGRNVLWTGTMNQDESTKSLSDKVIDRSIIIHFPKPRILVRRKEIKPLDKDDRPKKLLHKDVFDSWRVKNSSDSFTDEDIRPYKECIDEINEHLKVVHRSFGHRVWQSIEFYMANYPDVRVAKGDKNAMNKAFEDQFVQKVAPNLRGIDTYGVAMDKCLAPIHNLLINKGFELLANDFKEAYECGNGQFIWTSDSYLDNDEEMDEDDNSNL